MPHWLIKSGIQRVISWLPASAWWNGLFQQYISRSTAMSEDFFLGRMDNAARCLESLRRNQPSAPESPAVLEVGTGWYPALPIVFWLCGASEIHTFDIANLLSRGRLEILLNHFL